MDYVVWWPLLVLLVIATAIDVYKRRIPNWLTIPYIVSGIALGCTRSGVQGLKTSVEGLLLGSLLTGALWLLRGMGLGDVKLCAAVGGWIGPEQTLWMLFATSLAGGILAIGYAVWEASFRNTMGSTADLIAHPARSQVTRHHSITSDHAAALSIPYAPAIAIGTWCSFFLMKA